MTSLAATPTNKSLPDRDPEFAERLRARDPAALERFFDRYFDAVYGCVRRLVGSEQDAEDLTQDIFLNIHRALPTFDPGRRLSPWVRAIALNRIRDHWRRRPRIPVAGSSAEEDAQTDASERPDSELERNERDVLLRRAIYGLPLGMRAVLFLRVYDELGFEAIARMLELTPEAVRKRYSRALGLLRERLSLQGARP